MLPHIDFWPLAREVCDKYGVLLIADEVMTFGKTGKWFAMSHWYVSRLILCYTLGYSSICFILYLYVHMMTMSAIM